MGRGWGPGNTEWGGLWSFVVVVVVGSFVVHSLAFVGGLGGCETFTWRRGRWVRYECLIAWKEAHG